MAIEKFDITLKNRYEIAPNVMHFSFVRTDQQVFPYIPGQFITILLHDEEQNLKRRSYSVATIGGEAKEIEIVASYVNGGIASERLFHLKNGDTLHAMGPAGRLILPEEDSVMRYILVGTGTGIAPYRSMLPVIEEKAHAGIEFVILQGVQYRNHLLYTQDFLNAQGGSTNIKFYAHLSRQNSDDLQSHERNSYVQQGFKDLELNPKTDCIYLCGNPKMIDDSFMMLTEMGFATSSIKREKYISSN